MKAKLIFDLEIDQNEFELAVNAGKMYCALFDIKGYLRRLEKYEDLTEDQYKLLQQIREFYYESIENINMEI
jgi:hypothetical protein